MHWSIVAPFPSEFVPVIRRIGLDALLVGSEFDGAHCGWLFNSAIVRVVFEIDRDSVIAEAEYVDEVLRL